MVKERLAAEDVLTNGVASTAPPETVKKALRLRAAFGNCVVSDMIGSPIASAFSQQVQRNQRGGSNRIMGAIDA
ncbi:hypothetical protein CHELA40_10700 [Chelatococcus asaccharovorans]|nr:hypothetical protein CHELA40_10700 [Chelatococcus asaccharovorans]CAH1686237.1 hypothetical protein CHELA17_64906 [Chelatococcus asaccharovorans]